METEMRIVDRKKTLKSFFYTLVFNTLIAIFLTIMGFGEGFVVNFIFSQCIGISICSSVMASLHFLKPTHLFLQLVSIMLGILIGSIVGTFAGSISAGISPEIFFQKYGFFIEVIFLGLFFGSIVSYFFISRERISATEAIIQEERIKRLANEKKGVEAHLKLLQAQIEPHFLFNTLSNILSLLDSDLEKGKSMLADLIHYLRTSLSKSRGDLVTMAQEMEMVRAYLNIFKIRMGDRLRYAIDIPDAIKDHPFPPMLVQPLVENAIKHGLEPKIEGGEVLIHAKENGDLLKLEIADTGLGFLEERKLGVGLSNTKGRLKSLYGDRGRLVLEENRPTGLRAIIEVPIAKDEGNHRRR